MVGSRGGCWCLNEYFVPGHQHPARWPNLLYINSDTHIVSCTPYVISPLYLCWPCGIQSWTCEQLFCAGASAHGMMTKSAIYESKCYFCIIPYVTSLHVEWQPWKSIRGLGTWRMLTSEQLYFVTGHQYLAWWSDSRYMKPDTIVSYLYHLSCFCWITTLWNRVVFKAHGGCCCPGNYFVPVYQHLAWWLYPRHINQILSFYIDIYVISLLNYNPVENSRGWGTWWM